MKKFNLGSIALAIAMLFFSQTVWASAPEVEPNQSPGTAMNIAQGDTITGNISAPTDADYFKISLAPGLYVLHIDYPAAPAVRDWWRLLDEQGNEIAHECYYPTGAVHLVYFKICAAGNFFVEAKYNADLGLSGAGYLISVNPDPEDPGECNDNAATVRIIPAPDVFTGKIALKGDPEFFKLKNVAVGAVAIAANTPAMPGLAFEISLFYDPSAAPIATAAPGSNSLQATVMQVGDYFLLIKYAADTATMHPYLLSAAFTVGTACAISVDSAATIAQPTICGQANGSLQIPQPTDGVAPYSYTLNNGTPQDDGLFSGLAEGNYAVLVTDVDGCTASFLTNVACVPCAPLVVGISSQMNGKTGVFQSAVQGGAPISFLWNFGDGTTSNDPNPTHVYAQNAVYTVTLSVDNGCTVSTASAQVTALSMTFFAGKMEGFAGDTLLLPIVSKDAEGILTYVFGGFQMDTAVGRLLGFVPGKAPLNNGAFNTAAGIYSYVFAPNGAQISIGDTLFFAKIVLTGNPGDSSVFSLNGVVTFQVGAILAGAGTVDVATTFEDGSFKVRENIKLSVKVVSVKGLPVSNVTVNISNGTTVLTAVTDVLGNVSIEIPYADSLWVTCEKDTILRQGITPNQAFNSNRILIFLPMIGLAPYSYVAANFDCGNFTTNDVVKLLQWIVGMIDLPCPPQLVFIPQDHVFPTWPNAQYFNYPTQKMFVHPNPDGETATFVCVVKGDLDGSVNPSGLMGDNEDRNGSAANWKFSTENDGELVRVQLFPDAAKGLVAGSLDLQFDQNAFELLGADFVQAKSEHWLVFNQKLAAETGALKLAFLNNFGKNAAWDKSLPLIELVFRAKNAAAQAGFDLNLSHDAAGSQSFDMLGMASDIALERVAAPVLAHETTVKIFPNPASSLLFVNLPSRAPAQIEVLDLTGNRIAAHEISGAWQAAIPVGELSSGSYLVRVTTGGRVFVQKMSVMH